MQLGRKACSALAFVFVLLSSPHLGTCTRTDNPFEILFCFQDAELAALKQRDWSLYEKLSQDLTAANYVRFAIAFSCFVRQKKFDLKNQRKILRYFFQEQYCEIENLLQDVGLHVHTHHSFFWGKLFLFLD